jgi:hypothetical protein
MAHQDFNSIDQVIQHMGDQVRKVQSNIEAWEKSNVAPSFMPLSYECVVRAVEFLAKEVKTLKEKSGLKQTA